ncbi:MAG: mechanosensitive ion channel, partial [Deltaproteobacteria bacterium]|nr:mechanosensitive ion channel [Deltaproteobacteria bacterium]
MQPAAGVELVKRLRERDYPGLLIATDALASQAFADGFDSFPSESERKGFYTNDIYASTPFLSDASGKIANEFKQNYVERYEREPDWYAAFANDAAEVLVAALQRGSISPSPETISEDRKALRDALVAIGPEAPVEGVTGPTAFDRFGDVRKPVPMGRYLNGDIVSALEQLQMLTQVQGGGALDPTLDRDRVVRSGGESLYRTSVARVGVRANRFDKLNFDKGTFYLDFDIWFRHEGDHDVEDIVFTNAIDPIDLGEPIENWEDGPQHYRLYRAEGMFQADILSAGYGEHSLSISFHHRNRTRTDLALTVDRLGMNFGRNQSNAERVAHARKVLGTSSPWQPVSNFFFEEEIDAHGLGHPLFLNADGSGKRFSQLTMGLVLERQSFSVMDIVPKEHRLSVLVVSLIASLLLLLWRNGSSPKLRWFLQLAFAALVLICAEPLLGTELRNRVGPHPLERFTRICGLVWWGFSAMMIHAAINRFVWRPATKRTGHRPPSVLRYFVTGIVYLFAFIGALAFVYHYRLTGILATSGVLAMIIGLAVQLNITNIFAGVAINIERPFRVGDWIMIHGRTPEPEESVIGRVVDINWRTTRLLTADETEIIIPNGVISEKTITNFMAPGERCRFQLFFTLDQSHPPEAVIPVMKAAIAAVTGVEHEGPLAEPEASVRVFETTENGIVYMVRYFLIPRLVSLPTATHTINDSILRHLRAAGFKLAYAKREILDSKTAD